MFTLAHRGASWRSADGRAVRRRLGRCQWPASLNMPPRWLSSVLLTRRASLRAQAGLCRRLAVHRRQLQPPQPPRAAPGTSRLPAVARRERPPPRCADLAGLEIVASNPRSGLPCWVLTTLTRGAFPRRPIHAELHHDGSVVLALTSPGRRRGDGPLEVMRNPLSRNVPRWGSLTAGAGRSCVAGRSSVERSGVGLMPGLRGPGFPARRVAAIARRWRQW